MTDLRAAWDFAISATAAIRALALTPDGRTLVSAAVNGTMSVWDLSRLPVSAPSNSVPEQLVDMSPEGRFVIVNSENGAVLRDMRSRTDSPLAADPGATFTRQWRTPADIWDASWLAAQGFDGVLRVWRIEDGQLVAALRDTRPNCCALLSRQQLIVYLPLHSEVLCIDDVQSGKHLEYRGFSEWTIDSIAPLPGTDQFLVVSAQDVSVHAIDTAPVAGHRIRLQETRERHGSARAQVRGRFLLLREYDYIEVWDLKTGARLKHYKGEVTAAVLTPDDQRLIVADGRMVKVLDLSSTSEATFYADTLIAAVASPDSGVVLAASVDGVIHELELRRESPGQ